MCGSCLGIPKKKKERKLSWDNPGNEKSGRQQGPSRSHDWVYCSNLMLEPQLMACLFELDSFKGDVEEL